jgi:hemerythrin-like metal-binding protein
LYINFDDKITLDIDVIDGQHNTWIEIYNEMFKIVAENSSDDKRTQLLPLLKRMHEYTDYHFKSEENLFEHIDYPQTSKHKKSHEKMSESIFKYYKKILDHSYVSERHIFALMKEWILDHILTEDREYADYIRHNGIEISGLVLEEKV